MDPRSVFDQAVPFVYRSEEVATIRSRIESQKDKEQRGQQLPHGWVKYERLTRAELGDSLRSELARREGFQRRAQAFLGTVAVMSAFTIGMVGLLRNASLNTVPLTVLSVSIFATLAYLGGGAWFALGIIRPEQVYDLFLQNRVPDSDPLTEEQLKRFIIHAIHMNQAYNLIFASYSERAYRSVRNGLLGLMSVLAMLVVDQIWLRP